MRIVNVCFHEYQGVLAARIITGQSTAILIDATWKQSSQQHLVEVFQALKGLSDKGHTTVYRLMSNGDDDIEALLLYTYGGSAYPYTVIENAGNSADAMSIDSNGQDVDHGLAAANIRKLISLVPSPSLSPSRSSAGITLFVSGDRSSVGKSTCCLALLISLIRAGVPAGDVSYIKPVTQCEAEQDVVRYCNAMGISCQGLGPVVFYKGFTRAFLSGETDSSEQLIQQAVAAVQSLQRKHKFVIVDGVGYPAVGSICGVSNAHIASALNAPVWLVGKSGVGDAVDSYNLNSAYFKYYGCSVLGGIFNKLPLTGFYSLEACKAAVGKYFEIYASRNEERAYGFMPEIEWGVHTPPTADPVNPRPAEEWAKQMGETLGVPFEQHVSVDVLLADTYLYHVHRRGVMWNENNLAVKPTFPGVPVPVPVSSQPVLLAPLPSPRAPPASMLVQSNSSNSSNNKISSTSTNAASNKRTLSVFSNSNSNSSDMSSSSKSKRSREEIEQRARQQGARGG